MSCFYWCVEPLKFKAMKKFYALLGLFSFGGLCACSNEHLNTSTVAELDLNRYVGKWYEIARFDHRFERGLVGCTATYTLQENGFIKVVNAGYKKTLDGKYTESVGKARRSDENNPGKLEVAFFANFYADYYVLELADDYRYALVGSKSDKYLWILSRTPQMSESDLDFVLKRAQERGYNMNKLIWVEQRK